MNLSDKDCVERCRNGHPDDFRMLLDRYQKPVFSFLVSRMDNGSEAEEAAEESFVRAFQSLTKLRKPESFYSWLLGIAGRVAKEQLRASAQRDKSRTAAENAWAGDNVQRQDYALEEAIALLPPNYREVILLRYYEGLSCQEIATQLAIPLGSVTKNLSRAYALLRQNLTVEERMEQTNESTV